MKLATDSKTAGLLGSQTTSGRVFNQEFVVAGLAYLCSRLVQPSIQERAAITLQRAYRNKVFREGVHKRINLLLLAHDCADFVRTRNAAICIQRRYRDYLHTKIQGLIAYVTSVQCHVRGHLARRMVKHYKSAAILVQRKWRAIREERYRERMGIAKHAFVGMQAIARGILIRRRLFKFKDAVRIIERRRKDILLGRLARESYLNQRNAAVAIQATFRRYHGSKGDRLRFLEAADSVRMVQGLARGFLARQRQLQLLRAALLIQSRYCQQLEARAVRANYNALRQVTIFIQHRWRETVSARSLRNSFLLLKASVSIIKERFREKQKRLRAAVVLQRTWRRQVSVVRMRQRRRDATVLQAAWRGYITRKHSGPRLRIVRKRLTKLFENGIKEDDRIGPRTMKALELVKTKAGFSRGISQLGISAPLMIVLI